MFCKIISFVFVLIGLFTLLNAVMLNPETSIHQIYQQLQFLTSIVEIGIGILIYKN